MEEMVRGGAGGFGGEEELGLVAIDNFGEGHFQDGWEFVQRSRAGKDMDALRDVTTQPMYHVLKLLTSIRANLGPVVILTTQALVPQPPNPSVNGARINPFPRQHLAFPFVDPFLQPPLSSSSAVPSPNQQQQRLLPPEITGLTHHITLLVPGERLKGIELDKGLDRQAREEEKRVKKPRVRGILRVVGGVGGAREGRSWEVGVGRDGLEVG